MCVWWGRGPHRHIYSCPRAAALPEAYTTSRVPTTQSDLRPTQVKLVNDDHEQVQDWKLSRLYLFYQHSWFYKWWSHAYRNLQVNVGRVGLHGDPNILNKALRHLCAGPATALSTKFIKSKSFIVMSIMFTASPSGGDFISRNHFLCSSVRSNSLSFIRGMVVIYHIFRLYF